MARFIFITGGVVSSLGKGLASAALGALLQARGYTVRLRKLDPYLNVDPGTMSPYEHGEVFVTDDGAETDLDLGHYERFTGVAARGTDSISSGRVYSNVLERERRGDYLGKTIQVIPHVTDEIKDFIRIGEDEVDFMLCEIGGTVGDIEGLPFFEAIRQFSQEKPRGQCLFMHLTLLPFIKASGELKTKPTQHSVKELRSIGLAPDILVCRSEGPVPVKEREKLALFCNVRADAVIAALDATGIDLVDISGGTYFPGARSASDSAVSGPYFLDFAARARRRTDKPLMVTGGFKAERQMTGAIDSGNVDVVGLARALVLDPAFPNRLRSGSSEALAFPRFDAPPEGGVTAWYTMRLTALGEDRENDDQHAGGRDLDAVVRDYERRDADRAAIWRERFET